MLIVSLSADKSLRSHNTWRNRVHGHGTVHVGSCFLPASAHEVEVHAKVCLLGMVGTNGIGLRKETKR